MSDNGSTDFKKDELSLTSTASNLEEDITVKKHAQQEIPSNSVHEANSFSSVFDSSDPSAEKPDIYSTLLETNVVARRYKITLAQARRMALNAAKRAQKRRERALEKEADVE